MDHDFAGGRQRIVLAMPKLITLGLSTVIVFCDRPSLDKVPTQVTGSVGLEFK
jgi:hypothetical protein